MPARLYIVSTPIGNLEDITYRAVRILREVDIIACEDTRTTRRLLDHYAIPTRTISYHEHNEQDRARELLEHLERGESIALVSDAGTPLLSDPGYRVVHGAVEAGVPVEAIPGPSALLTALVISGLPTDQFHFAGFFPAKESQRMRLLESLRDEQATLIFYEAPHRILEALADLETVLGDREIAVARELTKIHEEVLRGTPAAIRQALSTRDSIRGEFVVLVAKATKPAASETPVEEAVESLILAGVSRMDALKTVARERGFSKREIYRLVNGNRGPKPG